MQLSTPRFGRHIRWRRGDIVGEGAYARVYQCLNVDTGELMAVKSFIVLFIQIGENSEKIKKQLAAIKSEISILRKLSHANIVNYYQADLSDDMKSIDILLEFIPGGNLKLIITKYKTLEIPIIRNYGKQLLEGLKYLHSNKIIHRDLKPANILITQNGVLKLTDFGSCKEFTDFEISLSKSLKGSPYWMAPEVVRLEGHSFSADIWSFGCILIEMVKGRPPWSDLSNDSKEVMELIARVDPSGLVPETETELAVIIRMCLNTIPELRPTPEVLLEMEFFNNL